ncbi:MAG: clan AA aspartic protease, partial [Armatimonadota bacterium]|nr:clan AA aspartic protease [Armatimonadota bacterium]
MIVGQFLEEEDEAVIPVTLRGPDGREIEITAVVDTGFTGSLTLPLQVVHDLGLPQGADEWALLGDGSRTVLTTYEVSVVWDGRVRRITAYGVDGSALVGVRLLRGSLVTFEFI